MKLYLSGPITNNRDYKEDFAQAEKALYKAGFDVVNPLKLNHEKGASYGDYMRVDIKALCDCDALALIRNDIPSDGVNVETLVAHSIGIPCAAARLWAQTGAEAIQTGHTPREVL